MKTLIFFLFITTHLFAQEKTSCRLDVATSDSINPYLWDMLKSRGYYPVYTPDPDLAWKYIMGPAKDEMTIKAMKRLEGRAVLVANPYCKKFIPTDGSAPTFSCNPELNRFEFKALSESKYITLPSTHKEGWVGEAGKVFTTRGEAETYVTQELSKKIPTCSELRKKFPKIRMEKNDTSSEGSSLANTNIVDTSRGATKERSDTTSVVPTSSPSEGTQK